MSNTQMRAALEDIEDLMVRAEYTAEQSVKNGCLMIAVNRLAALVADQAATIARLEVAADAAERMHR